MRWYKIAKGKNSAGMLVRLVANFQATGPVPMELVEDLRSPRTWGTELQGAILSLLAGAYQVVHTLIFKLRLNSTLALFCVC